MKYLPEQSDSVTVPDVRGIERAEVVLHQSRAAPLHCGGQGNHLCRSPSSSDFPPRPCAAAKFAESRRALVVNTDAPLKAHRCTPSRCARGMTFAARLLVRLRQPARKSKSSAAAVVQRQTWHQQGKNRCTIGWVKLGSLVCILRASSAVTHCRLTIKVVGSFPWLYFAGGKRNNL